MGLLRLASVACALSSVWAMASCGALLDVDDIRFGDATGDGGAAAAGGDIGVGASGGQGGEEGEGGSLLVPCGEDRVCAPPVPEGFDGPIALVPAATGCSDDWPAVALTAGSTISDGGASCSGCGCGASSGPTCGAGSMTFYEGGNCNGGSETYTPPAPNVCLETPGLGGADSAKGLPVPVTTPGSCAPVQSTLDAGTPSFSDPANLCGGADEQDGCDDGALCVPDPGDTGVCVHAQGEVPCPVGYPTGYTLYQSLDDQRGCATCSCGNADGETCSGEMRLYLGGGCSTVMQNVTHDNGCHAIFDGPDSIKFIPGASTTGTCEPTLAMVTGQVVPTAPITVCCLR